MIFLIEDVSTNIFRKSVMNPEYLINDNDIISVVIRRLDNVSNGLL